MYSKIFVSVLFSILFALAVVAAPDIPTSSLSSIRSEISSGVSVATSKVAGAVETILGSSAFVPYAGVQTPLLVAFGSVLVSALLGIMMTLS